jgi:hypothetical protein
MFWLLLLLFSIELYSFPFIDNGNGTVKDNFTNLIWQKCSVGKNTDSSCSGTSSLMSWQLATQSCKNLNLAGRVWRLPNINELYTLVDYNNVNYINTTIFPNNESSLYWSSTTQINSNANAWRLTFFSGTTTSNTKTNVHFVRCVSGP